MESDSDNDSLVESSDGEFSSSDSESDTDDLTLDDARNWCSVDNASPALPPPKFPFKGNPGLKVSINDKDDVAEYFNLFFDHDIMSFIVSETNRYAASFIQNPDLTPSSRFLKWQDTDVQELHGFLSILLLQGIVKKPVERWFWSSRPILRTPVFGQIMSSTRYALLMKFLHFEDSDNFDSTTHPNPKLRKIYNIQSKLLEKFKSVYLPEQEVCIDESLLGYKGMLGWKQYIPTKRARFGIKMFQ